jgi:hypothetical protein
LVGPRLLEAGVLDNWAGFAFSFLAMAVLDDVVGLGEELFFGEELLLATADTIDRTLYPTEKAETQAATDGTTNILYVRILYKCSVNLTRAVFSVNFVPI